MSSPIRSVVISVATYQRPDELERLLTTLTDEIQNSSYIARVVVVDNDPSRSAERTVANFSNVCTYDTESTPGIVAARNRGLRHRQNSDAVIFVDDDEYVSSGWLNALVTRANSSGAGVVAGPVTPVFQAGTPAWLIKQGWYDRRTYEDGASVKWPATNNSLVRSRELDKLGNDPFHEEFSFTGGEDADMFDRLRDSGTEFVWASDAKVFETVPSSRTTLRWLWRRNIRLGNVSGIFLRRRTPVIGVLCIGLARVLVGFISTAWVMVFNVSGGARWACHLPRGIGVIANLLGRNVVEYARPSERVK